jgi:hypothetical protein
MGTATAILVVLIIAYLAVTSLVHEARKRRTQPHDRSQSQQSE